MAEYEVVFKNGKVWHWADYPGTERVRTRGPHKEHNSWFVVRGNKFGEVGRGEPPASLVQRAAKVVDLGGRLVLPGLHDAHIHLYLSGESYFQVNLGDSSSVAEVQKRLLKYSEEHGEEDFPWVVGSGWEQDVLEERRYLSRHDLDAVVPDRPVVLWRVCMHIAVCNSAALRLANIIGGKNPTKVDGGEIDLDEDGEPTGILRESAMELVKPFIEQRNEDMRRKYFALAAQKCVENGLTAVQTNDPGAWRHYSALQSEGKLGLRVFLTIPETEMGTPGAPAPKESDGRLLSCDRVKVFADGSLGAETAALRKCYRCTHSTGVLIHTQEQLDQKIGNSHRNGYRLEVHAIGDRAAEAVLDALQTSEVPPSSRPVLTHCQVLGADLISRMSSMGVVANIQPSFVVTDAAWARKRLNQDDQEFSYAWKTLLDEGVHCSGGSDSPIETWNPLQGMYDAIFRAGDPANPSDETMTFHPSECLTFDEALHLYTIGAAYAADRTNVLGFIQPDFLADFVVLDRDVSEAPASLPSTNIDEVWVDGKLRHLRNNLC